MKMKINQYIKTNKLLLNNSTVIVGVSGGVDSICLLHILIQLGFNVVLAHVNHHKREASNLEEKAMENLAKTYGIPFECAHYFDDHTTNFHDAAHNFRYSFFKNIADKYNTCYIASAHHLDDQAETIIMKLMNGSNLYGYGGISKQLIDGKYIIIRPLLSTKKEDLYNYAKSNNLIYFEDESNQTDDYLRNKIRHNVIPMLESLEPNILEKLEEFSNQCKEAFNFIRSQSIKYLDKTQNTIELNSFILLDEALKKDIICLLLERYPIRKNNDIINQIYSLLSDASGNKEISLKNGYFFIVSYDKAKIVKKEKNIDFNQELTLDNEVIFLNKYRYYFSKKIPQNGAKYIKLCYNSLNLPFFVRTRKNGDFINMGYGNKKVSKLMIDHKLTTEQRANTPLIFDNNGDLLWVYPIAKSKMVTDQKLNGDIFLVCEEIV